MPFRPAASDAQVSPTSHGLLAAVVSAVVGVAAHGFGAGHGVSTAQVLLLGMLAVGVGLVRAAQLGGTRRRSNPSGLGATAALIVGGQVAAHVVLSLTGASHGVGHALSGMLPGPAMVAWHVVAVPAAVAVLVVAEALARAWRGGGELLERLVCGIVVGSRPVTAPAVVRDVRARTLLISCATGSRGPPVAV